MPTPHGDHGMAFGMREVGLIRRALVLAMKAEAGRDGEAGPPPAAVDFWLLDRAIAEAEAERERMRVFRLGELAQQRAALPGSAATYLATLEHAVDAYAHTPTAEDLAALRALADHPCGAREQQRRATLLAHCTHLADQALDRRLTARARARSAAE